MPQLHPAEYVLPGHPDKLADAIADAIVQEATRIQPRAIADICVLVASQGVRILGRLDGCPTARLDLAALVQGVAVSGGCDGAWALPAGRWQVFNELCEGPLSDEQLAHRGMAEDQAIVVGHAVDLPGTNYLPGETWLANRLAQSLAQLRTAQPDLHLGPSGKVIILLEEDLFPTRLAGCAVWLQQAAGGPVAGLERAVRRCLTDQLEDVARRVPGFDPRVPESVQVTSGAGLPSAVGITGRQVVSDCYGPRVPMGGGSLSGRDFYQPQRAGSLMARRLAKAVVLTGAARTCRATLSFVPGQAAAQLVSLVGDTGLLDASRWAALLDSSLAGFGDRTTGTTDLVAVARSGHFCDPTLLWENVHFDGLRTTAW